MYACKNCSANLKFDIESQMLLCPACGTKEAIVEPGNHFEAVTQDYMEVKTHFCSACAGELIAEETEAAVFCPYCGNSTIVSEHFKKVNTPKYIVPFGITKEECKNKFAKMMKGAVFAPKEMRNRKAIDSFRGIYMPYWFYSFDINGKASLTETKVITEDLKEYEVKSEIQFPYHGYAKGFYQDASSSFKDEISDRIKPFDTSQKKAFSPAYMSGFYADSPDTDSSAYAEPITKYVTGICHGELINNESLNPYLLKNIDLGVSSAVKRNPEDVVMLPVWFLSYKKGNRIAYATVNGQNGTAFSDVPIDYRKFFLGTLILFVLLFVLLNLFCVIRPTVLILIAAFFAVLVSLIFRIQIEKVYRHETSFDDIGVISAKELKEGKKKDVLIKNDTERKEEAAYEALHEYQQNAFARKLTTLITIVLGIALVVRAALILQVADYDSLLISLGLIPLLFGGGKFLSDSVRFTKHLSGVFGHIVLYIAVLVAVVVYAVYPVEDMFYYFSAFISLAASVAGLFDLIRQYNILATRPLPQFKRTGGDDNA